MQGYHLAKTLFYIIYLFCWNILLRRTISIYLKSFFCMKNFGFCKTSFSTSKLLSFILMDFVHSIHFHVIQSPLMFNLNVSKYLYINPNTPHCNLQRLINTKLSKFTSKLQGNEFKKCSPITSARETNIELWVKVSKFSHDLNDFN